MGQRSYFHASRRRLLLFVIIISIVLTTILFGVLNYANLDNSRVIPSAIKRKISYQVYVPSKQATEWKISSESIKYDDKQGLLSMTIISSNNKLFVAEQNTPAQFTDIPQYYPALLSKLSQYSVIQTNLGEVTLTHPKELNGDQTAVLNSHGCLLFVRPQNNLTDAQWLQFFNTLVIAQ